MIYLLTEKDGWIGGIRTLSDDPILFCNILIRVKVGGLTTNRTWIVVLNNTTLIINKSSISLADELSARILSRN